MKRLFTFVIAMLLGASLAFAQAGGGTTDKDKGGKEPGKDPTGHKPHHKGHKGGKKSKKGAGDSTTTPPPK